MTADVNVTEKVARALYPSAFDPSGWVPQHFGQTAEAAREDAQDEAMDEARKALAALSDPEVLAGMAGVLREHSESKGGASFMPSCRCGWVGSSRMAWVADLARHQATALADWLRGHR